MCVHMIVVLCVYLYAQIGLQVLISFNHCSVYFTAGSGGVRPNGEEIMETA